MPSLWPLRWIPVLLLLIAITIYLIIGSIAELFWMLVQRERRIWSGNA
jgi:hypothetical protein